MAGEKVYRMYTLMSCPEIEAFAGVKKAKSKSDYFRTLSMFVDEAGNLIDFDFRKIDENKDEVSGRLERLQELILDVNSPTLLLKVEKLVTSIIAGRKNSIPLYYEQLRAGVDFLCRQIAAAESVEPTDGEWHGDRIVGTEALSETEKKLQQRKKPASKTVSVKTPQSEERQKRAIKREPFEKLYLLIDNFEMDDAVSELKMLTQFTYSQEVDTKLESVGEHLARFDYQNSVLAARELLHLVESAVVKIEKKNAKKKILTVDDVPDVLNTVKAVLRDDYHVYAVTDHISALRFLSGNSADLILLDIEMPDMDGFELLKIIRKIQGYADTPILFLTGRVSLENIKMSVETGSDDFIRKPVDAEVLLSKVRKYLER